MRNSPAIAFLSLSLLFSACGGSDERKDISLTFSGDQPGAVRASVWRDGDEWCADVESEVVGGSSACWSTSDLSESPRPLHLSATGLNGRTALAVVGLADRPGANVVVSLGEVELVSVEPVFSDAQDVPGVFAARIDRDLGDGGTGDALDRLNYGYAP